MKPHNHSVAYDRVIFAAACLALCIIVALAGCQTTTPVPTPTPTRTPILPTPTPTLTPTATPTLTPSPTVTPSPTLPPSLVIPAEVRGLPASGEGKACPTLPADLYFIRDASLWICLAHGGNPEPVPVAAEAKTQRIAEYRLTPDGRYLTYSTEAGELFVFDRARWEHTYIPTSGRLIDPNGTHFALTEDGTTLFYLAWGVQPSSGPAVEEAGSASLLSIDVTAPTRLQQVEAVCRGLAGRACGGFSVSPDERHAAFVDARGVWALSLRTPLGPAVTLQRAEDVAEVRQLGIAVGQEIRIHSWSPDGQWLLLELGSPAAPSLLLLARDAESVALATASSAFCGDDCLIGTAWDGDRLWVTWDTGAQGCIQATDTGELAGPVKILHPEAPICQVGATPLHPRSPGPARHTWMGTDLEGAVSFLQPAVPGSWPGLYTYALTGELVPRVLLPETDGTLIWTGAGDAFLYIDHDQTPAYLGDLTTPVLWDVHELLQGAHSFTWSQSTDPLGDQ